MDKRHRPQALHVVLFGSPWLRALLGVTAGLFGVLLLLARADGAPPRVERTLVILPIPGDTLRVVATVRLGGPGSSYEEAAESIRIVDGRGASQFSEAFWSAPDAEDTLTHTIEVSAEVIEWSNGRGVRVDHYEEPSAPGWEGDCRYFALRGRSLVPVTSWCRACGEIGPDDSVIEHRWMYWFAVVLPQKIHFDRPAGGLEIVHVAEPGLGDLESLEIVSGDDLYRFYEDSTATFEIPLFDSPGGWSSVDTVRVGSTSDVTFQRACVSIDRGGFVKLRRVEVVIDGRRGYVEESDLEALGLRQAG